MTWISSISSVVPANTGLYTCLVSGGRYNLTSGISESWFVFTSRFKGETLLLVRERTTPKKQPEGVRRPIEVVKRGWNRGWKSFSLKVLEDSSPNAVPITLRCSFTYDHDLHESLRLAWIFDSGSGPKKRIGPRESGRVTMRWDLQNQKFDKKVILQGCSGPGSLLDVSISTSLDYISDSNHKTGWAWGWWLVHLCRLNQDGQGQA